MKYEIGGAAGMADAEIWSGNLNGTDRFGD
jgi:hypothetical protein